MGLVYLERVLESFGAFVGHEFCHRVDVTISDFLLGKRYLVLESDWAEFDHRCFCKVKISRKYGNRDLHVLLKLFHLGQCNISLFFITY